MPGRISCPTLVGREAELLRITTLLRERVRAAPLILVRGEAGIGKSRLLRQVIESVTGEMEVLTGRCVPVAGRSLPYGPILDALRPLPGTEQPAPLASLRSSVWRALDLGDGSDDAERPGQPHLFETAIDALEAVALEAPVLLAIEDLHWSDAATRDLIAFLATSRRSDRLLMLATVRSDEAVPQLVPLLTELDRGGVLERVELGPLDDEAVADVVTGIIGREPDAALLGSIARRAGGNPFFIEELVASGQLGAAQLPPNLGEIMLTRLASLPDDVQAMLKVMAVIGDRSEGALLEAVTRARPSAVARRLRVAAAAHVVSPGDDGPSFRHALMREAIYADLLPAERSALHERIARTLASHGVLPEPERHLALGLHWDRADRPSMALPALARAAELAAQAHAYADAADLYARCIERLHQHPDAASGAGLDEGRLHELAAIAAYRAGDTGTAIEHVKAAISTTDPQGDPARAGVLHQHLCEYLWQHGLEAESIAATAEAYRLVPREGHTADRILVVSAWSSALIVTSRFREALDVVDEGLALADELHDGSLRALCLAARGVARVNHDDLEGGIADLEEAVRLSRTATDPDVQAMAFIDATSAILAIDRNPRRALELAAEWGELQRDLGTERSRGTWLAAIECDANLVLGRWDEADHIIGAAMGRATRGPVRLEIAYEAARLWMWMGRFAEAAAASDESLVAAGTFIGQQMLARVYAVAVDLAAWRGDAASAIRRLDEVLARMLQPDDPLYTAHLYAAGIRALADEALRIRARRRGAQSDETLEDRAVALCRLAAYENVPNLTVRLPETRAWQAQCAAELSRLRATPDEERAWQVAASRWDDAGAGWLAAYARWRRAAVLLGRDDRREATAELVRARADASAVNAGAVLREIDALAARARIRIGIPPSAAGTPSVLGLTAREAEVLELVARGMTNRQIGAELFISEKTAGVHVSNILAKLDVSSRSEATALAVRSGAFDTRHP